jgi:exodeoxyribonuclease VII small subunit
MATEKADAAEPTAAAERTAAGDVAAMPFDTAFAELRRVIEELEAGGLPLEETISRVERAAALPRHCEKVLGEAELRVRQLVARPGGGLETRELRGDEPATET